jgi:hypothetical protein
MLRTGAVFRLWTRARDAFLCEVMSEELVHKRRSPFVNNVTFPRELREAIPDHEPSAGRCLKLESVDAQAAHAFECGRRVQVKLHVCETGKLSGKFDVRVELEIDAARALAKLIESAADQAETLPAVRGWPTQ